MKKSFVTLSIIVLVLICLIGCKQDVEIPSANMGSITGKVFYSNGTDNSGILLTLDKTDGMRTISKEDGSRSVIGMCYSKEDGSFGFYNLEPGTYTIYASSNDSLEKAVSTNVVVREAETSTIESLQLTATGSISGTVSIDGSTTGNSGFLVFIAGTSFMAVTNDGGQYTITGIPAGAGYQLIVSKGNYISSEVVSCAVQAKTTTYTGTRVISLNDIQTGNGTLVWKGSFGSSSEIQNPVSLWAYYNTTDGCSYVFNGTEWTLLASKGETGASGTNGSNGVSITWQGELPSAPDNPRLYWAYYNSGDGCSYIFDGEKWTLLASKGAQGIQGEQGPQGETGATGVQGDTGATGAAGANGVSIIWLGSFDSAPSSAVNLNAYYNNTDGCSYIYNGTSWTLLASKGAKGDQGEQGIQGEIGASGSNGVSISWKGSRASDPSNPELYWAYYNTEDGCSYIFDGNYWTLLASRGAQGVQGQTGATGAQGETGAAGTNGQSIIWKGSYSSSNELENPVSLWAFFNTTDGCSYIYDGLAWVLLASKGSQGEQGLQGEVGPQGPQGETGATGASGSDGVSITWKGSRASDPSNPELYWAYYNTEDGCSYIYDGNNWTLLASKGEKGDQGIQGMTGSQGPQGETGATGASGSDGVSIIWLGSFSGAPADPDRLNAYYNTETGSSYIYNGTEWELLASKGEQGEVGPQGPQGETGTAGADGSNGSDGISIVWKGELSEAPANPQLLWAYYNTQSGSSYIFNGSIWTLLAQKGAQGDQGIQGETGVTGSDGNDGVSISWKGELSTAPVNPQLLWAYFNTSDGRSYIYNGTSWDRLSEKGDKGDTGDDGQSIVWKDEYSSAPASPQPLWAYHNTTDGNSYIYYNGEWSMLAEKGEQGHTLVVDVAVEPTCTETGLTAGAHCVFCSYVYEEQTVIPATGHTAVEDPAVAATCTTTGLTRGYHCSVCGDIILPRRTVDALGHTPVIDAAVAPTCTENGLTQGSHCSVCDAVIVAQEVAPATGHTPVVDAAVASTCHSFGYTEGSHCATCGYVIQARTPIAMTAHSLVNTTVDPTCLEQGYDLNECENCDYVNRDNFVDALGHDYDDGVVTTAATCTDNGVLTITCQRCGSSFTSIIPKIGGEHEWETAWSADDVHHYLKCQHCPAGINYNEHSYDQVIVTTPATCTTDGERTYTCSVCGHVKHEVIPATGHNYSITDIIAPTCTDRGYTSHVCSGCADEQRDTYTEALGHNWSEEWVSDGSKHWHECERCGLATTKLDHSYSAGVTIAPTCTEDGYTRHICSICDYHYDDQTVPMLGHSYTSEITTAPTCTENGERTYTCGTCSDEYVVVESMLGHVFNEYNVCMRCGLNRYEDRFTISGTTLISFNGTGVTGIVSIPAGITTIGSNAFLECTGLTQVIIPNSVTTIGEGAFTGCTGITTMIVPDSVITIESRAFARCSRITDLTIPDSVQSIGNAALYGCTGLQTLNVPFIGSSRIADGTSDAVFGYIFGTNYYAGSTSTVQNYSDEGSGTYYIPSSLRIVNVTDADIIPYGAFFGCIGVTTVNVSEGVSEVGDWGFGNSTTMTTVTIGDGIIAIGKHAFDGDTSLETVTIADGIRTIDDYAFQNCSSLTSVSLPSSIESKGHGAFYGCGGLNILVIDVPEVWDTTNTEKINRGFFGTAQALFIGDSITSTYQWYVDNNDLVNIDGTPISTGSTVNFSTTEVFLELGDHVLKCVAEIDGETYEDTYHVIVSSDASIYTVRSLGQSGGYIIHAKNSYSNGWRFLEAAPADLRVVDNVPSVDVTLDGYSSASPTYLFGYYRTSDSGSNKKIGNNSDYGSYGQGSIYTNLLVSTIGEMAYQYPSSNNKTSNYAARICSILEYTVNGVTYDDWFLPNTTELMLMYTVLKANGLGGFNDSIYWTCSEYSENEAYTRDFSSGNSTNKSRNSLYRVRPVRAF